MGKGRLVFRVDGGIQIGLGHLFRCFALAQLLRDNKKIIFCSIDLPASMKTSFETAGILCHPIKTEKDFFTLIHSKDIVVVDHYLLTTEWQIKVKGLANKLICIDDLNHIEYATDLIINHNPYVLSCEYVAGKNTKFALGFKYAMIRPVFKQLAASNNLKKTKGEVLICLGGSDNRNITKDIITTVTRIRSNIKLNVVVGQAYPFIEDLLKICRANPNIRLSQGIDSQEMSKLMSRCNVAIVSASGILIEALTAKCRIIGCYYANNQKNFHDNLLEENIILSFGDNSKEFQRDKLIRCLETEKKLNLSRIEEYRVEIAQSDGNLRNCINGL
ncbi:MAG: UDP-2,4-diacetamido-2,4,6-trideoxy-beta-L-altropyranose hydrolase [Maribacter sp.]|nr:UDP-2,4-diacetamido-2,4,6-trideoxy-beta-L-altropyranose hydrolase [Maribacter sp.]